jgi:APA family basic amino acid/polyamine antiporter
VNPELASRVAILKKRHLQKLLGWSGSILLSGFLVVHVWKDMTSTAQAWYFHSTPVWLIVMAMGSVLFFVKLQALRSSGTDTRELFNKLPEQ